MIFKVNFLLAQSIAVYENGTKNPIPYVTVLYLNGNKIVGGDYSDERGIVNLNTTLIYNKIDFSSLGYKSLRINNIIKNDIVYLNADNIDLEEIIISKNKPSEFINLGFANDKKITGYGYDKGFEVCVYIENNENKPLNIHSVVFMILKKVKKTSFRLHFYKKIEGDFEPKDEIFFDDLVLYIPSKTKGAVNIDISKYGLRIPLEGIFIGIEVLNTGANNQSKYVNSSDVIFFECSESNDKKATMSRYIFENKKWFDFSEKNSLKSNYSKKYLNAKVGIKVYEN